MSESDWADTASVLVALLAEAYSARQVLDLEVTLRIRVLLRVFKVNGCANLAAWRVRHLFPSIATVARPPSAQSLN